MDVLMHLAKTRGRVVSTDELLREVWRNRVFDDSVVYKRINQLRKAFGDDPHDPRFIATIPKRGYRLVATVDSDSEIGNPQDIAAPSDAVPPAAQRQGRRRFAVGLGAGVLLVGVAAAALLGGHAVPPREPELRLTPLSLEQKGNHHSKVAWSPDSRAIAFASRPNLNEPYQVYVRRLDSSAATQLTRFAGGATVSAWTSSGRLVFQTRAPTRLWSVSPAGGEPELLLHDPERAIAVAVTSDGSAAAILRRDEDGTFGIWIASLPNGPLRRYEPAPFAARMFANLPTLEFSPDGRTLLLMWAPPGGEQAWLLPYPPDRAHPPRRILQSLPASNNTPTFSWLPDNRRIVVSTAEDGVSPQRLYVADTVSGEFHALPAGTTPQQFPAVSPDGRRVLFTETIFDFDVVSLDLETAAVTPVVATNGVEQMPAWAMRAPVLVYVADRDGQPEIRLREPDGADRPLVTPRNFPPDTTQWFSGPELSPDASRVIYLRVGKDAAVGDLWMSPVSGGAPVRLAQHWGQRPGAWSPDGRWYVYKKTEEDGSITLVKIATAGQTERKVLATNVQDSFSVPVWSPAGDWILHDSNGLKLISPDGGFTRDLEHRNAVCGFADTAERLYCILERGSDGLRPFVAMDLYGRTERAIGLLPAEHAPSAMFRPSLRLTLTPDRRAVTYSIGSIASHFWLLDGLDTIAPP